MKQTIEIPKGFELKKVSDTEYKIVKKERCLPETWEEFCKLFPHIKREEHFINSASSIINPSTCESRNPIVDANILPSKEKAEAILALCQLIQLRDYYNDGWKPDWNSSNSKPVITFVEGEFVKTTTIGCGRVLVFKTAKLRDEFFDNFKDLIEKLKPLYE